jgi:hypothetical protein
MCTHHIELLTGRTRQFRRKKLQILARFFNTGALLAKLSIFTGSIGSPKIAKTHKIMFTIRYIIFWAKFCVNVSHDYL